MKASEHFLGHEVGFRSLTEQLDALVLGEERR